MEPQPPPPTARRRFFAARLGVEEEEPPRNAEQLPRDPGALCGPILPRCEPRGSVIPSLGARDVARPRVQEPPLVSLLAGPAQQDPSLDWQFTRGPGEAAPREPHARCAVEDSRASGVEAALITSSLWALPQAEVSDSALAGTLLLPHSSFRGPLWSDDLGAVVSGESGPEESVQGGLPPVPSSHWGSGKARGCNSASSRGWGGSGREAEVQSQRVEQLVPAGGGAQAEAEQAWLPTAEAGGVSPIETVSGDTEASPPGAPPLESRAQGTSEAPALRHAQQDALLGLSSRASPGEPRQETQKAPLLGQHKEQHDQDPQHSTARPQHVLPALECRKGAVADPRRRVYNPVDQSQQAGPGPQQALGPPRQSLIRLGLDLWELGITMGLDSLLASTAEDADPGALSPAHSEGQQETACSGLPGGAGAVTLWEQSHGAWHWQGMQGGLTGAADLGRMPLEPGHAGVAAGSQARAPAELCSVVRGPWAGPAQLLESRGSGRYDGGSKPQVLAHRLAATIQSLKAKELKRKADTLQADSPGLALSCAALLSQEPLSAPLGLGGSSQLSRPGCDLLPGLAMASTGVFQPRAQAHGGNNPTAVGHTQGFPKQHQLAGCSDGGRPVAPPASDLPSRIKERLFLAAAAVERRDQVRFQELCNELRQHTRRTGTASQRTVHLMVQMLNLRFLGKGPGFTLKTFRTPVKDLEKSLLWYHSKLPYLPLGVLTCFSAVLPKLVGRPCVHVVIVGDSMNPYVPMLMHLLAAHGRQKQQRGQCARGLESIRVTSINFGDWLRPSRRDVSSLRAHGLLGKQLGEVAAALGVQFALSTINVSETTVHTLRELQGQPGEAAAVCFMLSLKFASPHGSVRIQQELMQSLVRLKPLVVACAETDLEAGKEDFLGRFEASVRHFWGVFHSHDAVADRKEMGFVLNIEQLYFAHYACRFLACEGLERRVHPHDSHGWQQVFQSWGFQPCPFSEERVSVARNFMMQFPLSFELRIEGGTLKVVWNGNPIMFTSAWTWRRHC